MLIHTVSVLKHFYNVKTFASSCSHRRCSVEIGPLEKFTKFTGKHLCQSLFLHKVADLRPAILLKKRLGYRCFPMNFEKLLRTSSLHSPSEQLLLCIRIAHATITYLHSFLLMFCIFDGSLENALKADVKKNYHCLSLYFCNVQG